MRVLVAHASVHGGTTDIARTIADELGAAGHTVDVREVRAIDGLAEWDAVVVGGGLYASLWPRRARRFVARHADELSHMPVWLFSSGPLDDSASRGELPPTPSVARLARGIAARGHHTFGGRLAADTRGFIARSMARRGLVGDFRDMQQVRAWARTIAAELHGRAVAATRAPIRKTRPARLVLVGLCTFTGLTALAGGLWLVSRPEASLWRPLPDLLILAVAAPNLLAAILAARRAVAAPVVAAVGGAAISSWFAAQLLLRGDPHPLHALYLAVGAATVGLAAWLYTVRRAAVRARAT